MLKFWKHDDNPLAAVGDPRFPYVITTYRLTEHYLSGVMSRWNPWLAELMPELFIELSPELAAEKGIRTPTGCGSARRGRRSGPRHWSPAGCGRSARRQGGAPGRHALALGLGGVVTGDVVNTLTAMVGDPNVSIHEGKAFVVQRGERRSGVPGDAPTADGVLHRHHGLHRLQGLRGGLQGVEPAPRDRAAASTR